MSWGMSCMLCNQYHVQLILMPPQGWWRYDDGKQLFRANQLLSSWDFHFLSGSYSTGNQPEVGERKEMHGNFILSIIKLDSAVGHSKRRGWIYSQDAPGQRVWTDRNAVQSHQSASLLARWIISRVWLDKRCLRWIIEVISHKPGLEYEMPSFKTVETPVVELNSNTFMIQVMDL